MGWLRFGGWLVGTCVLAIPAASDERETAPWPAVLEQVREQAREQVQEQAREQEGEELPASPQAGFVSPWTLGYADFVPQSVGSDDCHYDVPSEGNGGFVAADSPTGVCCLVAGVHLPDGATVSSIFFFLRDASADDVTISLRRKRIDDESTSTAMGSTTTSGTGAGVRIFSDVSITQGLVDNRNYSYFVSTETCLDQDLDLRLVGGLVFFTEES